MWLVATVTRSRLSQRAALDGAVSQPITGGHRQWVAALEPPAFEASLPSSHKKPGLGCPFKTTQVSWQLGNRLEKQKTHDNKTVSPKLTVFLVRQKGRPLCNVRG